MKNKKRDWYEMLTEMNELRTKKMDGWTIHLVNKMPELSTLPAKTFVGAFTWTCPQAKTKWMLKRYVQEIGAGWVSPSDIARDYLAIKFEGKRQRCTTSQYRDVVKIKKSQPLYAEPVTGLRATYLDLKSAYWQALMCGGWDVEYNPNKYLSARSSMLDFPCPHIKLARNCLVSMSIPNDSTVWIPEYGLKKQSSFSSTVNLVLWGFVQDFLHGFAHEMVKRAGACYVNTDGYIVPRYAVPEAMQIADEWGVDLRPKYDGFANVRGAGDYDIADHRSKRPRVKPMEHSYIDPPDIAWFKRRFKFFSHRINTDWSPYAMYESELTQNDE